ncbi:hypothetical protein [Acinetobacter kyonggiensis]|jgi:hypothetical protein|uniref:Lipoprotein n=2 Tax=Acinetobacter TaxID=469 RepID=A0A1H3M789_9GAMM|nr:hypothetical protein [Acinetobacter kyonggiensis]SDY72436.1 hypothetical protein SAMN05421643_1245 [Acinetobacter kyonggiensis]
MNKLKLFLVLVPSTVALTGCLQMLSPTVGDFGSGVYQINTQSNAFGSSKAMRTKLLKKADELCKGKGFDELDGNNNIINNMNVYNAGMVIPVSTKASYMKIKCKD